MTDPKMVPESDLIALKESHAGEITKLTETHEGAVTKLTEGHDSALASLKTEHTGKADGLQSQVTTATEELSRLRAEKTQLEEANKNGTATVEELKGIKVELKTAQDALTVAQEAQRTDLRTQLMGDAFKIQEKALEGKTVAELTLIRDALVGSRSPNSQQYTGGGGSGEPPATTGRMKVRQGLAAGDLKPS